MVIAAAALLGTISVAWVTQPMTDWPYERYRQLHGLLRRGAGSSECSPPRGVRHPTRQRPGPGAQALRASKAGESWSRTSSGRSLAITTMTSEAPCVDVLVELLGDLVGACPAGGSP